MTNVLDVEELYTMAWSLVRSSPVNGTAQEDAVQEAVIAGVAALEEYKKGIDYLVKLRMWSRIVDYIRREERTNVEIPTGLLLHQENSAEFEDDVVDAIDAERAVAKLMTDPRLTERQKEVLQVMLECEGDRELAANRLGMRVQSVTNVLTRVREALDDS